MTVTMMIGLVLCGAAGGVIGAVIVETATALLRGKRR